MNLTFQNPLFLLGLIAVTLPILIHRLVQRKAISRRFSAVHMLIQSQRFKARPQRLKHLLLLALRILAILSLVFLMARPFLMSQGLTSLGNRGAKVIIIDNSLSMGFREERGERYELAKKAAKEALEVFEGLVTIIPTVDLRDSSKNYEIKWMKPEEALREIPYIPISFGQGDPTSALSMAYHQLKGLKMNKEILFISDMARGDWEGFGLDKLGSVSGETGITFLRIGGQDRDSNLAIKGVNLAEGEPVVGTPARLEVAVSNLSDKSGTTSIQLHLSDIKVDQKSVELKAGEDKKVYFELFLDKPGWVDGEVKLSGDRLSSDDIFYFPLKVREKIKVLVVDGDPKTSLRNSESYFLMNALHPGGSESSPFLTKIITEGEMAGIDLKSYEAVFLLNVASPQHSKLASFLEMGRPLFIFLGDRVIPENYNSFPLLPWRLKELKDGVKLKPERIAQIDHSREVLRSLSGEGNSLKSASFHRYFKIEGGMRNLLTLENQYPLLLEADVGKSKLFLFASSADLNWNDLPLRAAYLPLIQGLLKEAIGLTRDSLPSSIMFGEPFEEKTRPIQIKGPQGGPGIYQFSLPSGEARRGVNPPFEESNLAKVAEGELKKRFAKMDMKALEYKEGNMGNLLINKKELWPYILIFLMVVLAAEMAVANGIPKGRGEKLEKPLI